MDDLKSTFFNSKFLYFVSTLKIKSCTVKGIAFRELYCILNRTQLEFRAWGALSPSENSLGSLSIDALLSLGLLLLYSSVPLLVTVIRVLKVIVRLGLLLFVRMITMSLSKPRVQYKTLTFCEKVAVIREVEKGLKKKCDIAKEYGIAPTTVSTFLKNKEKILNSALSGNGKECKSQRTR